MPGYAARDAANKSCGLNVADVLTAAPAAPLLRATTSVTTTTAATDLMLLSTLSARTRTAGYMDRCVKYTCIYGIQVYSHSHGELARKESHFLCAPSSLVAVSDARESITAARHGTDPHQKRSAPKIHAYA